MAFRDPEQARAYQHEWYVRNREKIRERQREYNQRARRAEPEKCRIRHMRERHGMSPSDWAVMWAAQDGCCYLCGEELAADTAVIEHDHRCCPRNYSCRICRRGLACGGCNSAIGLAQDDPALLRRMADALEAAQLLVDQRIKGKPVQESLI